MAVRTVLKLINLFVFQSQWCSDAKNLAFATLPFFIFKLVVMEQTVKKSR